MVLKNKSKEELDAVVCNLEVIYLFLWKLQCMIKTICSTPVSLFEFSYDVMIKLRHNVS